MGTVNYQPYIDQAIMNQNDKIVKDVVVEMSELNLTGDEVMSVCAKVENGKGDRYDSCVDQLDGTRKSGYSDSVTKGYWKAVGKGYKGTILEYSKKADKISKGLGLATTAGGFLAGLASSKSNQGTSYADVPVDAKKPMTKTTKIVLFSAVGLAVAMIGFVAFTNRNK